jgi:hypothetical protein
MNELVVLFGGQVVFATLWLLERRRRLRVEDEYAGEKRFARSMLGVELGFRSSTSPQTLLTLVDRNRPPGKSMRQVLIEMQSLLSRGEYP